MKSKYGIVQSVDTHNKTVTVSTNDYDYISGKYSLELLGIALGAQAVTYSGADVTIMAIKDNLVNVAYHSSPVKVNNIVVSGYSWTGHQNIHSVPYLDKLMNTKLGKLLV